MSGSEHEPDDGLESRLRADARAWEKDIAPTLTDTPPPVRTGGWAGRAPWLVAAAVIVLVAAVAIPLWATRSHTATPGPVRSTAVIADPQCPDKDGGTLDDAGSVEPATGSLVPAQIPVSMLICEYPLPLIPHPDDAGDPSASMTMQFRALKTSRTVTTDLSSVPSDLSRFTITAGSTCTFGSFWSEGMPAPEGSDFRVALSYPTGIVWLSDSTGPDNCTVAMGSEAVSSGTYSDLFARSLASGVWQPSEHRSVACPARIDASPYEGDDALSKPTSDAGGLLVPATAPVAVVLCGYGQVQPESQPAKDIPGVDLPLAFLERHLELQGDVSALVAELRSASPGDPATMRCPKPQDDPTPQFIGLTYGEGTQRQTIWVDARIGALCGLTTNGATWASGPISDSVRRALTGSSPWAGSTVVDLDPMPGPSAMPSAPQTSAWPTMSMDPPAGGSYPLESLSPEDEECGNVGPSYEGLSRTMIPDGYTSVVVCFGHKVSMPAGLVTKINALSEPVDASKCPGGDTAQDPAEMPALVFLYPDRSPVWLYFDDQCAPLITNGAREVAAPRGILDQLMELAGE